jgi:magnesium transporter
MAAAVAVRWLESGTLREGGLEAVAQACASGHGWIDVTGPERETLEALREPLGLHPLAIEDVLHDGQRPKMESYAGNLFFVWLVCSKARNGGLHTCEIDVFLGKGWLLTTHSEPLAGIDAVAADPVCVLERGPEWTLHAILDRSVDDVFPLVDAIGDRLDVVGDHLLESVDRKSLPELHSTKRLLLHLHKVIGPERDALRELAREQAYVSEEAYRYFQDITDHLARVEDRVDTYRDVAASVMDIYLSAVSNQLNVVMKRLTVVATIFMPGTLVASIFGMNVGFPFRDSYPGLLAALALIVSTSVGMYVAFKRSDLW